VNEISDKSTPKIEWFRDRSADIRSHVGTRIDLPTTVSITCEKCSSVWFALRTSINEEILN
jgi:hypothetical protein